MSDDLIEQLEKAGVAEFALTQQAAARIRELEAQVAQSVKVKPLEWRDSYGVSRADTPFGDYMVSGRIVKLPITSQAEMISDDPESAAQADYERRILSALEPAPLTPAEARENVVDTIEEIICETHDLDVRDRDYAENVVAWLEKYHPAALRALAEGEE